MGLQKSQCGNIFPNSLYLETVPEHCCEIVNCALGSWHIPQEERYLFVSSKFNLVRTFHTSRESQVQNSVCFLLCTKFKMLLPTYYSPFMCVLIFMPLKKTVQLIWINQVVRIGHQLLNTHLSVALKVYIYASKVSWIVFCEITMNGR